MMRLRIPLLAASAFAAITFTALATGRDAPERDDTVGWTDIAQIDAEEMPKAEGRQRERRAQKDDDDDDDDEYKSDDGSKRKRVCPRGERPTPRRGRGGDFGGCITR
jgi:hypothetical protein